MIHPNELDQQLDNLRTLQQSYNVIAQEYSQEKSAIIQELQAAGVEIADDASLHDIAQAMPQFTRLIMGDTQFADDSGIYTLGDAILSTLTIPDTKIKKLHSNYVVNIPNSFLNGDTALEEVELNGVITIGNSAFANCQNLKSVILRAALDISYDITRNCPSLIEFKTPLAIFDWWNNMQVNRRMSCIECLSLKDYNGNTDYDNRKVSHIFFHSLYFTNRDVSNFEAFDLRFYVADEYSTNVNFVRLLTNSFVLHAPDKWSDPEAPVFHNAEEQMLWYFKKYILYNAIDGAPLFTDMTGQTSPTLTLPSGVRDLVMQDADVAAYFTSRNWTVA